MAGSRTLAYTTATVLLLLVAVALPDYQTQPPMLIESRRFVNLLAAVALPGYQTHPGGLLTYAY